jgi:hypothetical protein
MNATSNPQKTSRVWATVFAANPLSQKQEPERLAAFEVPRRRRLKTRRG